MPRWILLTLLAVLGFGTGSALQSRGVNRAVRPYGLPVPSGPSARVRAVLADPIWLLGTLLNVGGALLLVGAVHAGELSVVQPLAGTNVLVAMAIGGIAFGERLRPVEWAGAAVMLSGAATLGIATSLTHAAPAAAPAATQAAMAGLTLCVLLSLAPLAGWLHAGRGRELPLGLAAGLLFGLGTAYVKLISTHLVLRPDPLGGIRLLKAILSDPALTGVILFNLAGFVLYQAAFAGGRVSLVSPVVNVSGLLVPVVSGVIAFGEPLRAVRLAGILAVAAGVLVLGWASAGRSGWRP